MGSTASETSGAHKGATQRNEMLAVAMASLFVSITTVSLGHGLGALGSLGIYFDGHFYIDIAKSFPLPYDAAARDYLSHAPGYAGLIAIGRLLTPDALNWGVLAVIATWLSSAGAALAFYLLCREFELPALQASLCFAVVNPTWVLVSAAPHAEPLAMAFVLLCFVAHLRGALPWSVLWLSLAALTRYPAILLGAALAFDVLIVQRRYDRKTLAWLSVPVLVFGLYNLYLAWRLPGFSGLLSVHQIHWNAGITIPFSAMLDYWREGDRASPQFPVIFATAAFYTAAAVVGLRPSQKRYWWLAVWVLLFHGFHVSLSGQQGAVSFTRLALLAWPAALLILWQLRPSGFSLVASLVVCVVMGSTSIWLSERQVAVAVYFQSQRDWMEPKLTELDSDEPNWIDFIELGEREKPERQSYEPQPEF